MMMSSPAQLGDESSEMTMNSIETPSNPGIGSRPTNSINAATSPSSFHTSNLTRSMSHPSVAVGVSPSSSHSQPFNIESFDFGADFSLPTSLDELNLFQHHQQQQQNLPSGSNGARTLGGPPSNDGMVDSPSNLNFSPRNLLREQQQQHHLQGTSNSRTQSPHHLSNRADEVASASSAGSGSNFSNTELHNLLRAVQSSYGSTQQDQQGPSSNSAEDSSMSLSDMERFLQGKEQAERMQMLQTSMLRQQLETLQRQQNPQSSEANHTMPLNINASQLMHQFHQLTSQQNASTPTQQNMQPSPFQQGNMTEFNSSQKVNLSALTQYGLITPLSSGPFTHGQPQASQPFVSPIHLPSSSQPGLMDAHRSYDPNYTPLESPAITPASVFSNIGSGNTTSQDFFSPLTSPALRPHVGHVSEDLMLPPASPHHGPILSRGRVTTRGAKASPLVGPQGKKTTTPGASPATAPTKSVPRKNRSTTAEARANRARPSPLVKPTVSSTIIPASSRKTGESISTAGLISPMGATFTTGTNSPRRSSSHSRKSSLSEAPLQAASGSTKAMEASPSEDGASTTPSPIELDASSTGKPMTPGSIMGIDARKSRAKLENGKQVSFAGHQVEDSASPGSLQSILPGGISSTDREAWSSFKSGGGGGGGGGGGIESRRTSHKAAEQKRRDSLKFCFDELRGMLPAITLDDDAPGGSSLGPDGLLEDQEEEAFDIEEVGDAESARLANRAISKVALLRHSNEYLIRLKNRLARRDRDLEFCRKQVIELRSRLEYPLESQEGGVLAEYMPMTIDATQYEINENNNHSFGSIVSNHMDIS